jgi:hypothetical protein
MVPLLAPIDCGANVTLQPTLCPAFSITGKVSPLSEKLAAEGTACKTISFLLPEFVSVSACV